jgi:endonuclease/exonuclease/phosphatase family metal-dependent hydrolase
MTSTSRQRGRLPHPPMLALIGALATGAACGRSPVPDTDPASSRSPELRVMSFNIRYGTAPDAENAWPGRRALLLETIRAYDPDVLGVQEALRFQLDEIGRALPGTGEVGVGRDDGAEAGEYSAILYDRARLTVLDHGTVWLSDAPDVPGSMTWGNEYPRVVTWARFRDDAADTAFVVLNTHWDHQSQNARERSAAAVVDWIAANAPDRPVVLMGDFNAGEDNPAFLALLGAGSRPVRLRDTFRALHPDASPVGTYHAFTGDPAGDRIDAILVSPGWRVMEAAIVRTSADGRYPSDHFPVTATLVWTGGSR